MCYTDHKPKYEQKTGRPGNEATTDLPLTTLFGAIGDILYKYKQAPFIGICSHFNF